MHYITFPSIGLNLNINPVAIKIFNVEIYWYAILMVFAIVLAYLLMRKQNGKYGISFETLTDLLIYLIPVSLITARIYYVIFSFDTFKDNLLKIFNTRTGGMAIPGAIIGGIITTIIFCRKRKINTLDVLDYMAPYLALGQAIGRWGNFINAEAYGGLTNVPWRMGIYENGSYIEVHPTFLYETILDFIIFILLIKLSKKRKVEGEITYIYLILYSFIRLIIEGLRTDSLMFFGMRITQALCIATFIVFSIILTKKVYLKQKLKEKIVK